MVSDEIEKLRALGKSDEGIAAVVEASQFIRVTAEEIAVNYAPPEARHP